MFLTGILLLLAGTASAQTAKPVMPEILHDLLAGKTFRARMEDCFPDDDMNSVRFSFMICEQESYRAEDVESLTAGDTIVLGKEHFVIKAMEQDETGYILTGENDTVYLIKNDREMYNALTDTENRFYKALFSVETVAAPAFRFFDYSDPEAEKPTELTIKDLLERYRNDIIVSTEENTVISFDNDGNLIRLEYHYTPWN